MANEYNQFDRFVVDLLERQYEPVAGKPVSQAYTNAGELWEETMNKLPLKPPKNKKINDDAPPPRVGPDVPLGRLGLREQFGHDDDGYATQVLQGILMTENTVAKPLFAGDLHMDTFVQVSESTGAPTEYQYTLTNMTLRDVDISLDFSTSRGVGAVTTDSKLDRDSLIRLVIKSKETVLAACLKPKKKKKMFSWEADSDDGDGDGGDEDSERSTRKKKSTVRIYADVKIKWVCSREVSFQLLSNNCSAVYNARGETDVEKYYYGRSNENIFEWIERQESAAVVDGIKPSLELGRMVAFLRDGARDYAVRVLESFENAGITGMYPILHGLKTALKQAYGNHNQSLLTVVDAGLTMQIKKMLRGDVTTYNPPDATLDHVHVNAPQQRLDYQNLEPLGPRCKDALPEVFGRDPRIYPQYPESWPRTIPFATRLPIYGRSWQSHLNGTTALHVACANDHLPVAKALLHFGWRLDVCDYHGRTPVELARIKGNKKLHSYLYEHYWGGSSPLPIEHVVSSVVGMMREARTASNEARAASQSTKDVVTSMENTGLLGMNQLLEFRDATEQFSSVAEECSKKATMLAEAVHGKDAVDNAGISEEDDEQGDGNGGSDSGEEEEEEEEEEGDGTKAHAADWKQTSKTVRPLETAKAAAATTETAQAAMAGEEKGTVALVPKTVVDADNYDMLNLWHVLHAGNSDMAAAAIRMGCKLQYMLNVGWQAVPSTTLFVNYGVQEKRWMNGGGTSLVHALVCQPYEFPPSKAKPCLLLLLDEGYPGDLVDMHGRTPADCAKKYNHTAMHGVLKALVQKTEASSSSKKNGSEEDDEDDDESDSETDEDNQTEEAKRAEEKVVLRPQEWTFTRQATVSENKILFGMCSGAHGGVTASMIVREAVFGGKSLFTHGSRVTPVVACRKREGEKYPVRYDVNFTTRFEPTMGDGLPELDGLGWSCLHVAAFAGAVEIIGLLLGAGWDPTTMTSRGQTSIDLARIMGHDAIQHALEEVSEGAYDVMVRGTTMFYAELRNFASPKLLEYALECGDLAEEASECATIVKIKYEEMKKEEERKKAELEAAGNKKKKKKRRSPKTKRSKSPKTSKSSKKKLLDDLPGESTNDAAGSGDSTNKKTFFRGRIPFCTNVLRAQVLDTWACGCTTLNPACATTCKFCHVTKVAQEEAAKVKAEYENQFHSQEMDPTSESWGFYHPKTFTLVEEQEQREKAMEKTIRRKANKSLHKKMRQCIKSSLKKFAYMDKVHTDAIVLAHMLSVVLDLASNMEVVLAINTFCGNDNNFSVPSATTEEEEDEKLVVDSALVMKIYLLAFEANQEMVDKDEVHEWLGNSDWRPPREHAKEKDEEENIEGQEEEVEDEQEDFSRKLELEEKEEKDGETSEKQKVID